jgi:hypothetical protein
MKKLPKTVNAEAVAAGADDITSGGTEIAKGSTLKVKAGVAYRGARQAWYEALKAYDGKPVAEFVAHVTATRPSVYGAKSKHAGQPEPVAGWLGFFVRTGVATIV